MTCQQLIKNRAKTVDVCHAGDSRVVAHCLFWRHVTRRAQHFHCPRDRTFCFDKSSQTKIGQMRFAFPIEQNVPRFDITMENAVLVSVMHSTRDSRDEFGCSVDWHRLSPNDCIELPPLDKFHAEVA